MSNSIDNLKRAAQNENLYARADICGCGSIHFIKSEDFDHAIENDKELVLICNGCGSVTCIGADREVWGGKEMFNLYSFRFDKGFEITKEFFDKGFKGKPVDKVIYSEGYKPMMLTGYPATSYRDGLFFNDYAIEQYKLERPGLDQQIMLHMIRKHEKESGIVNMNSIKKELTKEQIKTLAGYYIEGLNWE